jgi:outer membrane protein OmpU
MNNFKKIGITALAGSLVATSVAVAGGALSVSGDAEMKVTNLSQSAAGKTIAMGNSVTMSGSGELDNGLTVSMSFELDQGAGDGAAAVNGPYDNHSVTVASDSMGSLTVHGHGGSNAAAALDGTAAGDLWDSTLGITTATGGAGKTPQASASGNGLVVYTLPTLADGVAISASYASAGENNEGSTAFGLVYTGVEGLSVSLGKGDDNGTVGSDREQTIMKASYAYGPITVGYSNNDYDHTTAANDQETSSFNVAYTLTDSISIAYGEETIDNNTDTSDVEVEGVTATYTSGGMTLTAKSVEGTNVDGNAAGVNNDNEMWKLAASFAF